MFFSNYVLCQSPPPRGRATPPGVVIVKGIPFAYSGGGGFSQEKKSFLMFFLNTFISLIKVILAAAGEIFSN